MAEGAVVNGRAADFIEESAAVAVGVFAVSLTAGDSEAVEDGGRVGEAAGDDVVGVVGKPAGVLVVSGEVAGENGFVVRVGQVTLGGVAFGAGEASVEGQAAVELEGCGSLAVG